MDYEAAKKKWDCWIAKSLANLQRSFNNKSFFNFDVDYNGF